MNAGLKIYTLGGVRILRNGEPVVGLATRKTEALLIYLASTRRQQPREVLADLFWGYSAQSQALGNLRGALSNLHQVLGDTLAISRTEVSVNPEIPIWLDSAEMEDGLEAIHKQGGLNASVADQAANALKLYQGEFLEGFSVFDCPEFEQWAAQERERLHRLAVDGFSDFINFAIEQRQYKFGREHAARLLTLDPLNETAHRQMMRLLFHIGQRNAALNQYETCRKLLQEELGIQPEAETVSLYKQIQSGNIETREPAEMLSGGTTTFLYTKIEDSTRLLEQLREKYVNLLAEQSELLRAAFQHWQGREIGNQSDAFLVAFRRASDAVACAVEAQRSLVAHDWPPETCVRLQMGLYTGEPMAVYSGYLGLDVHHAAQIADAGHGCQVLLSQTTRDLVFQNLPPGTRLRDLGKHNLREADSPQQIFQLEIDGLPCDFPALKTAPVEEQPPMPGIPPFKGLQYFDEGDASLFFGRSRITDRLVEMVLDEHFLAVVGASGSGKSSVLRAGVVPALHRSQPGKWNVFILTPTVQPLEALAIRLTLRKESMLAPAALIDDLGRDKRSLHLYLRKLETQEKSGEASGQKVLLVIDQFEELFTMCRDEDVRQAFIDSLLYAAQAPDSRVHVLVALRADFYDHLAEYAGLRQAVAHHQEYLGAMSAEELRQAIEEPAKFGGWQFTPGLVNLLLHEVGAEGDTQLEPGALPLLSHALLETWKHRRGNMMSLVSYNESGGVRKAIAHTAERLYTQELTPAQQQIARSIFLRLTELGEGTQDTRRRVAIQDLYPQAAYGDPKDVEEVLLKLADARLIVTGEKTAEVAHEALIREWPMLHEWLMQDREGLRLQRHLSEAAQEWLLLEQDPGVLYRSSRLVQALEWVKSHPGQLNEQEQAFLDTSQSLVEQEEAEKEAARQRELRAAQRLAEEQSRSAARLRKRAVILSLALFAAIVMVGVAAWFANLSTINAERASQNLTTAQIASTRAVAQQLTAEAASQFARSQQSTAEAASSMALAEAGTRATAESIANEKAQLAFSRELAAAAVSNLPVDSQRSLLLAMHAFNVNNNAQAENALHQAIQGARLRDSIPVSDEPLFGVKYSPDGSRAATISSDGKIYIWSTVGRGEKIDQSSLRTIENPLDYDGRALTTGNTLDFSPDGQWLVGVASKNSAKVWDVVTGELLHTLSGHEQAVVAVSFSPDGKRLATGSLDATVKIWDPITGVEQQTLTGFDAPVYAVIFSKDGSQLIAGSDSGKTIAWKIPTAANNSERLTVEYSLTSQGGGSLAISPDKSRLVVASCFYLMIYDTQAASVASAPVLLFNAFAHGNCINGVLFDNSGNWIYTGSADGTVKEWEVATGQQLFYLSGNILGIGSIAINPTGTHLLAANYGGSLNTWEIEPGGNEEWFSIYGSESTGFITADGNMLITDLPVSETESRVDFWKFTPAGLEKAFPDDLVLSYSGYYAASSNPARLVVLREDETTRQIFAEIWDPESGKMWKHFPVFSSTSTSGPLCQPGEDCITIQSCSADGTLFTIVSDSGIVYQWDIEAEKMVQEYAGPQSRWMWSFFSPDGSMLSTAGSDDPVAKVWDTRTGELIMEFVGHTGSVFEGRFSQDGKRLITGSGDRIARVWDIQTGKLILALPQHTAIVHTAIFSPDGKYLATAGHDRAVKLWDAANGKELLSFNGTFVFFSPDSQHLIISDLDGIVRGYYLEEGELMKKARSLLIRTWTEEECSTFLHASTCPAAP